MIGNIWIITTVVAVVVTTSIMSYNSYFDMKEAKEIQNTYEVILEIKKEIAKNYNKPINEITRDEIIAHLPNGKNWEKLFLANKDEDQNFNDDSVVDENGNLILSKEDKLKLLAIKSKLSNLDITNQESNTTISYSIGIQENTRLNSEEMIRYEIKKIKTILYHNISILTQEKYNEIITNNTNFDINNIKDRLKVDLVESRNALELMIYNKIKAF